jgi:glycosyltransferase involved in cell wall biosynthesis
MKSPLISVVVPTYNRADTIGYCINSILNQTYKNLEIIIVDDLSIDNTNDKVKEINDNRIRYISLTNKVGAQAARNKGIKESKGRWIAFLDSDDEWLPQKLEKQVSILQTNNLNPNIVVHCNCYRYYPKDNRREVWNLSVIEGVEAYKKLLKFPAPLFQAMLVSKIALEQIDFLDERVISFQEWETSIRLSMICEFVHIQEPLFLYYLYDGNTISKNKKNEINGYQYIIEKHREEIIKQVGIKVYRNHLHENIQKALNWELWDEAYRIIRNNKKYLSTDLKYLQILLFFRIRPESITFKENIFLRLKYYLKRLVKIILGKKLSATLKENNIDTRQ